MKNYRPLTAGHRPLKNNRLLFLSIVYCLLSIVSSCNNEPPQINFGKDLCVFCKMTVMDKKFGAVLVNKNGKTLKFDSGECMVNYLNSDAEFETEKILIINYANPEELIDATTSFYLHGGNVKSPMGGQLAAFSTKQDAEKFHTELSGELLSWNEVMQLGF